MASAGWARRLSLRASGGFLTLCQERGLQRAWEREQERQRCSMMGSSGLCSRGSLGRHLVPPVHGLDMPGCLQVGPSSPFGWRELFILWGLLGQKYLLPGNVKRQKSLFHGSVAVCFGAVVSLVFSLAWRGGGGQYSLL